MIKNVKYLFNKKFMNNDFRLFNGFFSNKFKYIACFGE